MIRIVWMTLINKVLNWSFKQYYKDRFLDDKDCLDNINQHGVELELQTVL